MMTASLFSTFRKNPIDKRAAGAYNVHSNVTIESCRVLRRSLQGSGENSESGENPERCRRCKRVGIAQVKASHWDRPEKACDAADAQVRRPARYSFVSFPDTKHVGMVLFVLRKNGRGDGYAIAAAFFFCQAETVCAVVFSILAEGICRSLPPTSMIRRKRHHI